MLDILNTDTQGASANELARLSDFVDDNEQELVAMISNLVGVFFSSFDDMRVDRNVSVSVGHENINLHRAVISADYAALLLASAELLRIIRDNDDYVSLIFDAMWIADPEFAYTRREFLDTLDNLIEDLESEARLQGHNGEEVDIYLYINRRNHVVGFGMSPQGDDDFLSFVLINDVGYDLTINFDDTYVKLHGSIDTSRRITTGDLHILIRNADFWNGDGAVIEGKLLDFQYSSDMISITVSGSDILGLTDDDLVPDAQTADLLDNLVLSLALRSTERESGLTLDIRLLRPEISFTLLSSHRPLDDDYVSIAAPQNEDVLYLDLPALMTGNIFALLPHLGALMEIYNNLYGIAENLDRLGFDVGRLLEGFLDDLFDGLF
jgi:hypothetical protein